MLNQLECRCLTEDVDIVIAYQLMDLYVCTVTCTQCYRLT